MPTVYAPPAYWGFFDVPPANASHTSRFSKRAAEQVSKLSECLAQDHLRLYNTSQAVSIFSNLPRYDSYTDLARISARFARWSTKDVLGRIRVPLLRIPEIETVQYSVFPNSRPIPDPHLLPLPQPSLQYKQSGMPVFGYYYITDTRSSLHEYLVIPCLRYWYPDAEDAHEFGNKTLKALGRFGLQPRERGDPDAKGDLAVEVFGHVLDNPIGTSAGIDKHCEIPDVLFGAGPAIVEIGGVTPLPQEGNEKPRVWRIPSQRALVNRYGLNSEGADFILMRLRQRLREYAYHLGWGIDEQAENDVLDGNTGVPPGSLSKGKLLAVQIAKNKWTKDDDIEAVKQDYIQCTSLLSRYADIVVINVSSPNTPGLRLLQKTEPLTEILTAVVGAARKVKRKNPVHVMVKVSPDEDSEEDVRGICDAV
ncbi:MAG: hypothetical protein Q9204_007170, partial [Flavoplaca sp. TL-2023a]